MSDNRRVIPKKSPTHLCPKCRMPVYYIWKFSMEHDRQQPTIVDCEGEGLARPKTLIGGVGQIHVCRAKEKAS